VQSGIPRFRGIRVLLQNSVRRSEAAMWSLGFRLSLRVTRTGTEIMTSSGGVRDTIGATGKGDRGVRAPARRKRTAMQSAVWPRAPSDRLAGRTAGTAKSRFTTAAATSDPSQLAPFDPKPLRVRKIQTLLRSQRAARPQLSDIHGVLACVGVNHVRKPGASRATQPNQRCPHAP
jgi:hypothetical protein